MLGIAAGAVGTDGFHSPSTVSAQAARTTTAPASTRASAPAGQAQPASPVVAQAPTPAVRELADPEQRAQELATAQPEVQNPEQARMVMDQARAIVASSPGASPALAEQARLLSETAQALSAMDAARTATTPALASAMAVVAQSGGAQSHGTFVWSNDGDRLEVRYDGDIEFTDDDTDVKRLSPGGSLRIKEGGVFGGLFASHTVEFTADGSGNITRRFWDGMSERPFDTDGRQWLTKYLPRFIRQTGFGARARVARILKAKGPAGVLAEISLIEGSWGKRTYFSELLKATSLDAPTVRQVLIQAGREIDSDFELASLLIDNADKLLVDESTRQAYFEAARTIQSDFEMARVYKGALKRGPVSSPLLAALLDASRDIESDFEEATLLVQIAKLQPLDNTSRAPFFSALGTVGSDFEHGRVLKALGERTDLTPDTTAAMLISGASVDSDFEAASFLIQLVKQQPIEGTLRAPFFRAVESVGSAFERGRVLQAVAKRPDASPDTITAVLRATAGMSGNFEVSQVLMAVAAEHPVAGPARDAYIDAAEKLGDFEQGRALAALVRSERRK
jgi:hypothetical protein